MRFLLLTTLLLSSLVALGANGNSNQLPVVQKDESDIISVRRRKLQASSTCPANGLVKVAGSGGFIAWNDTEFRKMVGSGPNYNLIYRHCESCAVSHKDIYYKRLTPIPDNFDFLNLFLNNWNKGPANVLGIDFRMFSSIEYAVANKKGWQVCTYNGRNVGFPKSCSPNFNVVNCQWNSLVRPGSCVRRDQDAKPSSGASYAFFVICDLATAQKKLETSAQLTVGSTENTTSAPTPFKAPSANALPGAISKIVTPNPTSVHAPSSPAPTTPLLLTREPTTRAPSSTAPTAPATTTHEPITRAPSARIQNVEAAFAITTAAPSSSRAPTKLDFSQPHVATALAAPGTSLAMTTSSPTCLGEEFIIMEDFENKDVSGWANAKLDQCDYFTNFLGRYGFGDAAPSKTFSGIPTDASNLIVEFDFYEIDSWDGTDRAFVDIGGVVFPLGAFEKVVDEGARIVTVGDAQIEIRSQGAPAHRCFGSRPNVDMDQTHHVVVTVPPRFFADGNLVLKLIANVDEPASNESAGFDNIKITARRGSCAPSSAATPMVVPSNTVANLSCLSDQVVVEEDFENKDVSGWANGRLDQCDYFTNFLGRFGFGDAAPTKTFNGIPTDASNVTVEFDFYEIDSWDGTDRAFVEIDGVVFPLGTFDKNVDEGARTVMVGDAQIEIRSHGAPAHRCFNQHIDVDRDQTHHVVITLPPKYFADGSLSLKLVADVDQASTDESAGFDNIKITARRGCGVTEGSPVLEPTIVSSNPTCLRAQVVIEEDFENKDVSGWDNGKLDQCDYFTNFLGRYGFGDAAPSKSFSGIPTDASNVTVEFDFYEIDSWDGTDRAFVEIGGVVFPLGAFEKIVDEGTRTADIVGAQIEIRSQGFPANRCFGSRPNIDMDQTHHVTVRLPRMYFAEGNLVLKLIVNVDEPASNESAGFDNIKITSYRDC